MSNDVVSEARALAEQFRAAGRDCLRRCDASYRELGPSVPVRVEITVSTLRALLDALDRLDALAPLAEAAARVREAEAACLAAQAEYDAADRACTASVWSDPGDTISAQAERARADARRMAAHHAGVDANRALRRALARGER